MLINLIKLFQSAAGRSNFKQACKLMTHSGEKKSSMPVPITTEHYHCTSQGQSWQLMTTTEPATGLRHHRGSSRTLSLRC